MRFLLFLAALLFLAPALQAQTGKTVTVDTQPELLNQQEFYALVKYPQEAKKKKLEGTVKLALLVSPEGRVTQHKVLETPPDLLVNAVTPHLESLRFKPATVNGTPVASWVNLPVTFTRKGLKTE